MQALKDSGRAEGTETLYAVSSFVPAPLRSPMVKALASPRIFNLTISQSPGPRGDLRVLGCEMDEVYSVVPISEQHSLAIGMVRYKRELFIGCYAAFRFGIDFLKPRYPVFAGLSAIQIACVLTVILCLVLLRRVPPNPEIRLQPVGP